MTDQADEPETCLLCPASGPPRPPAGTDGDAPPPPQTDDDEVDLQWVACHKCDKWFHSVCIAATPEFKAASIPASLVEQMDASGSGEWFDWPKTVDKWYCKPCIDFSTSPENPRPPRHPLATTLKKPRGKRTSTGGASPVKRARRSGSAGVTPPPQPPSMNGTTAEPTAERRPKRQAALDRPDYYSLHNHVATPTKQWLDLVKDPAKYGRVIKDDNFPRVPGSMLRREWVESGTSAADVAVGVDAFPAEFPPTLFYGPTREPMVVHPENGGIESMGGMVPDESLTVDDVARLVGPDKMVDVIDVATQTSSQWPLSKWAEYVRTRNDPAAASSSKVYNIISLEISGTELAQLVCPPKIVSDVDWVENFWPFPHGKEATMRAAAKAEPEPQVKGKGKAKDEWPKVQLYCLMGMTDSWTDWHVDFAASSVYYSVHTGCKVFYFIRPTEANLAAYGRWSGSAELQASTWLPDLCDEVRKVTLKKGDTMIIPAGYIHAVWTPANSIVFGGNFVHSYDIPTQLRLRQVEIDTGVPQRFRFPFFDTLCWHVARKYVADLRSLREYKPNGKSSDAKAPYERVLQGLIVLAQFLIDQVRVMEDPTTEEKKRKLIWNRIPTEAGDAGALAHELLWRVRQELPDTWEDEEEVKVHVGGKGRKRKAISANGTPAPSTKRAKSQSLQLLYRPPASRTWQFSPAPWEQADHPIQKNTATVSRPRPGSTAPEDAEEATAVYHQSRRRVREENGELVMEEQDLVFTERRVVWRKGAEAEVKAEPVEAVKEQTEQVEQPAAEQEQPPAGQEQPSEVNAAVAI